MDLPKRNTAKKTVSFDDIKNKFSNEEKYKPNRFFDLGEAFQKACGVPGFAYNAVNQVLGHSNTSKTTALIMSAIDAQKKGVLPIMIITEQKWSFEHALEMGFDCKQKIDKDGQISWDGFFIIKTGFEYIEQIFEYINEILDAQKKDELPYDILFLWDSVGTIPCKMTFEGKGGTQHTARVIAEKFGMGIAQRITSTKKASCKYDVSMVIINQCWVELPDNPFSQPRIQPKGGQAIYYASSLVFLFGNQKNAGVSLLSATYKGRKVNYATRTKVSLLKNHINGISFADGKILATSNGYINDEPASIEKFKKDNKDYWVKMFEVDMKNINEIEFDESVDTIDITYENE